MTVLSDIRRQYFNGGLSEYDFTFKYYNANEIFVYVSSTDTVTDADVLNADDYTLTENPGGDGGTVLLDSPAPAGTRNVLILAQLDFTQETPIPTVDKLGRGTLEGVADKNTLLSQQLKDQLIRCLRFALPADVEDVNLHVSLPEAGKALVWNDTEDGLRNSTFPTDEMVAIVTAADASASASAAAAASSAAAAASSATTATTQASAASTSATTAAASATAAASSATAAASSASAASTSATLAQDWATKTSGLVAATDYSAKEFAQGTQAATGGSAKNWAQQTAADVTGAAANSRSAKSWAQEAITGATLGGSAKDWAQSASLPDGVLKSAKSYASDASTSATAAAASATTATTQASNAATSASGAATSATTATTQASNASTSATNAATSATNAATSETNAASSATAAAASAASAAAVAAGLSDKTSCRVTTTAALTVTYSNGALGVGATLTNAGAQAALSLDGVSLSVGDRVLVKNQATAAQNGIYTVTVVGTGSTNWVMTRATDYDQSAEILEGTFTIIEEGATKAGSLYIMTVNGTITVGTTGITFTALQTGVGTVTSVATSGLATGGTFTTSGTITVTDALVADVLTGTDTTKAVTANSLAGIWKRGSDIASASTIHIPNTTGGYFVVTGTVTITAIIDDSTPRNGRTLWLRFSGALTLTHNATSLILPGGANITTASGDVAGFTTEDGTNWRCICYTKADGTAVVATTVPAAAAQSDQETATSTTTYVTPGRQQFHPSAAKAWAYWNVSGTQALKASYNMTSLTDAGVGRTTLTIATDFSSANYASAISVEEESADAGLRGNKIRNASQAAGSIEIDSFNGAGTLTDMPNAGWVGYGDQ